MPIMKPDAQAEHALGRLREQLRSGYQRCLKLNGANGGSNFNSSRRRH
jgi:hypothetical protein